jgi:hypothetical protein
MTDMEACRYTLPWDRVEKQVRPFRATNNRKVYRERWWQYAEKQLSMQAAIADLDRVLVIARISRTGKPTLVPTGQVLNEKIVVFATDQPAMLALLSSNLHSDWVWQHSATLKSDLQYTPSDCFETFPQPTLTHHTASAGNALDTFRPPIMLQRKSGLTALYNDFHHETNQHADIVQLREIHVEIDEAVREAYALDEEREPQIREFEARIASAPLPSWREIDLAHGFHETPQGTRYTISPQARIDVLDKLLALNHYRYQQEVERGLHNKKPVRKPKTTRTASPAAGSVDDGALFAPPDALF